jgi:hypothetical protein
MSNLLACTFLAVAVVSPTCLRINSVEGRVRMVEGSTPVVPASPLGPKPAHTYTMVDARTWAGREIYKGIKYGSEDEHFSCKRHISEGHNVIM